MAIEQSMLTENDILDVLNKQYGIKEEIKIEKLPRGSSNVFKISSKRGNYVLKEFNSNKKVETVEKEISIINFLRNKDISVPVYKEGLNGDYYYIFNGKVIILQEYIEGYTLENNSGDYQKTMESARLLGEIVQALKGYGKLHEDNIMQKTFSKQGLQNSINRMEEQYNEFTIDEKYKTIFDKDIQDKLKIGQDLLENFDFGILNKLSVLATHGDYNVQQLIYKDNEATVIDFETAKKMPIVWEIMRSYSYIDIKAKDGNLDLDNMVDYFNEFTKYVKLNKYDLKYAPYVYLIQLVGSLFGYREYIKDNSQNTLLKFGLFRTNLCRYLYENANTIGDKLLTNVKNIEDEQER